jgi:tetratricopeptide (TPR) repeat protein
MAGTVSGFAGTYSFFAAERMNVMSHEEAAQALAKGLEALDREHVYLAMVCFEQAISLERTPLTCSRLAYCLAKVRERYPEAVALAREAISHEPENPAHYLYLGRIHMLAKERKEALEVLRQGLQHGKSPEIIRELEMLGSRKPAIFSWLSRRNPLNRYLGILLDRLGMR